MTEDAVLDKMRLRVETLASVLGMALGMEPGGLLEHLAENLPVGIGVYDESERLIYLNHALAALAGYDRDSLLGRPLSELVTPADRSAFASQLDKRKRGEASTYELFMLRKDGSRVRAITSGRPLLDAGGRYRGGFAAIMDATALLVAKDALRDRDERFEQLVRHAPAGIVETDLAANRFVSVNELVCNLTGYSREELLSMPAVELFAEPDRPVFIERIKVLLEGGEVPLTWEYQIRKKDGGLMWVLISSNIEYVNGVARYSRVVASDITAQKLAQQLAVLQRDIAMALGEARDFSAACDGVLSAVTKIEDMDCCCIHLVEPGSGSLVLTAEQGLGADFAGAVSRFPADHPFSRALVNGEVNSKDWDAMRASEDGARKSAGFRSLLAFPLLSEGRMMGAMSVGSRRADGISGMVRDALLPLSVHLGSALARIRAEEHLRDSEEKYRILVESATDAIVIVQDGKIKFPNPVALSMTGYSREEMVGMDYLALIHSDEQGVAMDRHSQRLSGELAGKPHDYRFVTKSGEVKLAQVSGIFIKWEGRPAVLMVARDITDQRRMEAQLAQAERMEAVGTLAGGVAHDFNNLLMTIQGNVSLMLLGLPTDHPHYARLKGIESSIQSGSRLTAQLLGYARGGKYALEPTDLNALVSGAAHLFARARREVRIREHLAEDLWTVEVDRAQIEQVLLNLLMNAWHAMPGGGDIIISTDNVALPEEEARGFSLPQGFYVRLSLSDTGVGMEEAVRKRIFEPFFTTREKGAGAGLGLASSYAIVKNHGGMIHVTSEPRRGSTFIIHLPASDKDARREAEPSSGIFRGSGTVLLVDDEPMIRDVAAAMLREMGLTVIKAEGGRQALEIFARKHKDIRLVILDLVMPDLGGRETFDALRKIQPDALILLASGYSLDGEAREMLAHGRAAFLQKPFDLMELSARIADILAQ